MALRMIGVEFHLDTIHPMAGCMVWRRSGQLLSDQGVEARNYEYGVSVRDMGELTKRPKPESELGSFGKTPAKLTETQSHMYVVSLGDPPDRAKNAKKKHLLY